MGVKVYIFIEKQRKQLKVGKEALELEYIDLRLHSFIEYRR